MILSAQSIRRLCNSEPPLIWPFVERGVLSGKSFGLSAASYDCRLAQNIIINRGEPVLASTMERFHLPDNVCGMVLDKSTHARIGISAFNTFLDPGWEGWLTLELVKFSEGVINLYSGTPICQVAFYWLDENTEMPYRGKY